jgi:hypothetical protein
MIELTATRGVYIDPSSPAYYEDRLFDISDARLNRDDTLLPFLNLKLRLEAGGAEVYTADKLSLSKDLTTTADYYSLGVLDNYAQFAGRSNIRLRAFVIFEPPVVDPRLYRALPALTKAFAEVYVHNTTGDGFSLEGVDRSKLRKLYWPQPREDVMEAHWSQQERLDRLVVINGNHIPRRVPNELYSRRIEAMAGLAELNAVDLYGRGWDRWWSRASMWWPYWKHRGTLMSIYKGACDSKYEVLSRYKFSLCFENMAMQGYVTEKIFDCFYAGTIPVYLGAPDIGELVPPEAYVDCRNFATWQSIVNHLSRVSPSELQGMREAGRRFIQSDEGLRYSRSLLGIFGIGTHDSI